MFAMLSPHCYTSTTGKAINPAPPVTTYQPEQRRFSAPFDPTNARRVTDTLADAVAILAYDGTLLELTTSATQFLGYRPKYLIGRKLADFIYPSDKRQAARKLATAIEQGTGDSVCKLRCAAQDGRARNVWLLSRCRSKDEGAGHCIAAIRDVTAHLGSLSDESRSMLLTDSLNKALRLLTGGVDADPLQAPPNI